jgi:hypothetical protein
MKFIYCMVIGWRKEQQMTHRIEISSFEAQILRKKGVEAEVVDSEDGYHHFYVNETPWVVQTLYPPVAEVDED